MMRTRHHMRIDVRGVLRNWNPHDWRGAVTEEGTGRVLSTDEVHEGFLDALAAGKRYLPFGKPCEGRRIKRPRQRANASPGLVCRNLRRRPR